MHPAVFHSHVDALITARILAAGILRLHGAGQTAALSCGVKSGMKQPTVSLRKPDHAQGMIR
jgi:hypothetical protein